MLGCCLDSMWRDIYCFNYSSWLVQDLLSLISSNEERGDPLRISNLWKSWLIWRWLFWNEFNAGSGCVAGIDRWCIRAWWRTRRCSCATCWSVWRGISRRRCSPSCGGSCASSRASHSSRPSPCWTTSSVTSCFTCAVPWRTARNSLPTPCRSSAW